MAKGFKHGAGGGAPLNFKVVGGTSVPSNPKENTIWVNTNTKIPGYIFSNKDPNLLNPALWAIGIETFNGTKTIGESFVTLTSTSSTNICYTSYTDELSRIPCTPGKTYLIQWDYSGSAGSFQLCPNGDYGAVVYGAGTAGKLEYTAKSGDTFFSFMFTASQKKTSTYSNIRITEKELAFDPGALWIQTDTNCPAEINILKKNCVIVYPVSTKQFVNGIWESKAAWTYQNGTWHEWTTYMYNMGDLCGPLTGGWQTRAWGTNNANNSALEPRVTYNQTSVTFDNSSNTSTLGSGVWEPVKDVDLTNVKEVKILVLNATSTGDYKFLKFMACNRNAAYNNTGVAAEVEMQGSNSEVTYTLNVENLSGSYDVCLCGGSRSGTTRAEISRIWFVKKE